MFLVLEAVRRSGRQRWLSQNPEQYILAIPHSRLRLGCEPSFSFASAGGFFGDRLQTHTGPKK